MPVETYTVKRGRPASDNPRQSSVRVYLTDDEMDRIDAASGRGDDRYSEGHGYAIGDGARAWAKAHGIYKGW